MQGRCCRTSAVSRQISLPQALRNQQSQTRNILNCNLSKTVAWTARNTPERQHVTESTWESQPPLLLIAGAWDLKQYVQCIAPWLLGQTEDRGSAPCYKTWDIRLLSAMQQRGKGLHSYIRQRGQLSYSIKSQLQEEKEARLNKTPEKEARGNMKLMHETDVCRREKWIEKENVCFEEARREGIMENEKKSCW